MQNIEHVVVVMMENRSFDNLLGWLYDNDGNRPSFNIPPQNPPTFEGLAGKALYNEFNGIQVPVSHPPTAWPPANNPNVVPTPDPNEGFDNVTNQIFGTKNPGPTDLPNMSGFLEDYSTASGVGSTINQIMQTYGPQDANVINDLARNFAVCDHWYASIPSQTWPNRAFFHTGSSDGHLNNDDYELYDIPTIFNVLETHGISWGVFHDTTFIPSLTLSQFLGQLGELDNRFSKYSEFKKLCQATGSAGANKLPAYSFIEPRFVPELGLFGMDYPSDYHPPHNICRGEQFLADVYQAVANSPYRDKILLVITFDEHGGCYDHVAPPGGAIAPEPWPKSRDGRFAFDRYGVRVPTILISSYIQPGTVFRAADGEQPYDHTSMLATLRDWLGLGADPQKPFLPSPRIVNAPTLDRVLTLDETNKRTSWPAIAANCTVGNDDKTLDTHLSGMQQSLIAGAIRQNNDSPTDSQVGAAATAQARTLTTYQDAINFLHPEAA